jgi:hypothetical protein
MAGAEKKSSKKKRMPTVRLKKNTVEKSVSVQSFFLINALLKPLLINDSETAIKTVIIPINPNSLGESNLARIMPTTKVIPCPAIVSTKLQINPLTVFCLRDIDYLLPYICS